MSDEIIDHYIIFTPHLICSRMVERLRMNWEGYGRKVSWFFKVIS